MPLARSTTLPGVNTFTPIQLLRVARLFAGDPDLPELLPARSDDPDGRRWHQLAETHHLQLWVIEWPPGASTHFHDHGGSRGAFTVVRGALTERQLVRGELHERRLREGEGRVFGEGHVHDVVNTGDVAALSVHAYSPRLDQMTHFDLVAGRLEPSGVEQRGPVPSF
ncbi:cysteine dioxygenase [Knoellia sinensis KCTC 19936]|uniref:Cysteine dioxygenase n=1 Tax=Knoellia sinensis KCTC 19936 TaxID=1385520 RepID=A0A0A0JH52_9MICO|nr:cysteine dioxygenase family protein [Knoellia sinensis]KGN34956.1 cysteine dioxygenase [Knoellia sinensis KCTC 19936]